MEKKNLRFGGSPEIGVTMAIRFYSICSTVKLREWRNGNLVWECHQRNTTTIASAAPGASMATSDSCST